MSKEIADTRVVDAEIIGWQRSAVVSQMVENLLVEADSAEGDGVEMLERILSGSTPDEMVPPSGLLKSVKTHLLDKDGDSEVWWVQSFRPVRSEYQQGGLPVFLVLELANAATGAKEQAAIGSVSSVVSLYALRQAGALPVAVAWHTSRKPTRSGFHPLNMELIDTGSKLTPPKA